jgi:hypothetical protein
VGQRHAQDHFTAAADQLTSQAGLDLLSTPEATIDRAQLISFYMGVRMVAQARVSRSPDGGGSVITPVVRRGDQRRAALVVDQDHPFFFDHPLDHVSGMLLVTGLLDLVRAGVDPHLDVRDGRRLRLSVKFTRFCELDDRVLLTAEPGAAAGEWAVSAVQRGTAVCQGTVELVRGRGVLPRWPADTRPVTPLAPGLAHRVDPRNVVLGAPDISPGVYEVPLLSPPYGHFLRRHGDERYGLEEIIEAGRQLFTAATHLAHGRAPDTQLVWIVLTADIPVGAVRSVPLALRWPVCPPRGNTGVFDYGLVVRGTGRPLGSLSYVMKSYPPEEFRNLRENGK